MASMNFFTPTLSTLFPLLSAVFVTGLGIFVVSKDPRNPLNRLFGLVSIVCVMWLFGTFMMFVSAQAGNDERIMFWDRFIYLAVVFVPAVEYHFSLVLSKRKPNRTLYTAYLVSIIFLFLSQSELFLSGLFRYQWGVHAFAGSLHDLFLILFFSYIFVFFRALFKYYKTVDDKDEKVRIILAMIAFGILDIVGGLGFLPAYGIGIFPISLIAPIAFVLIIGYSIIRYGFLNIETFTAQFAVVVMLILVGAQSFFRDASRQLDIAVFASVLGIGYFLIRSVNRDMRRKEELQEISDSLAKANAKLKELDNTKTEFISIASHQLRTPLTAIKGYLSLLLEGSYGTMSPEITDVLEKLNLVNRNLIQLVEDLLNVSRIDAGRIQYAYEQTDLVGLVAEKVDMFMPLAREKGVSLSLRLPETAVPELMLDAAKIRESVSNLIDNSLKYTKEGTVTVSVELVDDAVVRVSVADTGIGFSPEDGPKLFGKFVRTKETSKVFVSGTGLGLFVGKSFVEAHGGHMWAESAGIGKGATFFIELPVVNPKASVDSEKPRLIEE
ncbi:MAG: ATP-binding protein [Candidatus Moraniibacteriota bacterium]